MSERVVIVGPGRVGAACGRRLREAGWDLLGFVGRDPGRVATALEFAGGGRALAVADHVGATVVMFAVGDDELAVAVGACMQAAPPPPDSLWLHTSGCHDLGVFAGLAAHGAAGGSLHPVAPFADADQGYHAMRGQPAVLDGPVAIVPRLEQVALALGMQGVRAVGGDRALYHAACALAANGMVVLRGLVDAGFAASGGLAPADAAAVADALMRTAMASTGAVGAEAALSGPVRRGDAATIARHLAALQANVPTASDTYRALMLGALRLARSGGLDRAAADAVEAALRRPGTAD